MNSHPERSSSASGLSRRKLLASLGALTVAAGVGGRLFVPAGRAQSAGGVFVGKVDGTNAFVGIVTDGEQAEAYVCDGHVFKELFTGTMTDARNGRLTLMGEDGDLLPIDVDRSSLQSLLASGGSLTGALTIGGSSNTFSADPAMGPGALYLSIGTLPDGSTMDGGTIVLNDGNLRGFFDFFKDIGNNIAQGFTTIVDAVSTFASSPAGMALASGAEAAANFEETGETPQLPGTIGITEVINGVVAAATGNTQGALNILNGCTSGGGGPLCPDAPTANVNSVPLFTVSMKSGPSSSGTPPTNGVAGGSGATPTPASGAAGGGTNATGGAPGGGGTRPAGGASGGGTPGSTPQINPQPIGQAMAMMQTGQALSGPNGPQPVPVTVSVGATTGTAMMVPQTPAKLAQNGPPH